MKRCGRWMALAAALGAAAGLVSCRAEERSDGGAVMGGKPAPEGKRLVSRLAGQWYEADPAALRAEIDGYMAAADDAGLTNLCALLVPHAGYAYSGRVAAEAVRQARGRSYTRVVVLGPTHRVPMRDVASVPDAARFTTPLGDLALDTDFIARLKKHPYIESVPAAESGEHSVEIEFPLLQAALGAFKLVPVTVGQLSDRSVRGIADALRAEIDADTLVVVSSDFTHYGAQFDYVPFRRDIEDNLRKLDLGAFAFIEKKDLAGFRKFVEDTGATICGRDPIAVLLAMLPDDAHVKLLKYTTSGRMTGDWAHTVSYLSAAVTGTWEKKTMLWDMNDPAPLELTDDDKAALLKLARGTLSWYLEKREKPDPRALDIAVTPGMRSVAGAFVTLHKNGTLRGCIGEIFPERTLVDAVQDHALNAGLKDPRFPPVHAEELGALDFEISALTMPHKVDGWDEIEIGRHGIVLHKHGRSAVFLPQVAPEQGWGIEETLTHLSVKAGLPPDAWKHDARFEVFEAVVFGEKD